jgi:DNA (cytosine-5)-methyltransferase 1
MYRENQENNEEKFKIVSLFSGCGGLDLGFEKAGFEVSWANEFDKAIWETFTLNFPKTPLDKRSITEIPSSEIPSADGIIGGPPCQSWSEAGACRGINDHRGQLFFDYVRVLKDKQPLFFLAENVSGILANMHKEAFQKILKDFSSAGYNVVYKLLNAKNYNVPQDRERVIIVGYHKKMGKTFEFPEGTNKFLTLRDAIGDLKEPKPALKYNKTNGDCLKVSNHEYMTGSFSTIYMSRNRVRSWDEQSFTIQAGGRHAPIHPRAPKMKFIEQNKREFVEGKKDLYRRLSVRECARIQTFPDTFLFKYTDVADGYKMVGNAVPSNFAQALAEKIVLDLQGYKKAIKSEETKISKIRKIIKTKNGTTILFKSKRELERELVTTAKSSY